MTNKEAMEIAFKQWISTHYHPSFWALWQAAYKAGIDYVQKNTE